MSVPSDIEIAQAAKLRPITDVAKEIGLGPDDLDLYGKYKAKVSLDLADRPAKGKLVIVTAINPTAAGEGKTTTSVGLAQAFRKLGKNAVLCIREPSLGPVFGVKGGAAWSTLSFDDDPEPFDARARPAIVAGGFVGVPLGGRLAVQAPAPRHPGPGRIGGPGISACGGGAGVISVPPGTSDVPRSLRGNASSASERGSHAAMDSVRK